MEFFVILGGYDKGFYGTSQIIPPNMPKSDSASESEWTRIHIDLCDQAAQLVSSKPLRIKLIWMKLDNDVIEGGTEKKSKTLFYERMFKIDTKVKGSLNSTFTKLTLN